MTRKETSTPLIENEQDLQTLLAEAGSREEPPADHLAQIKAAAKAQWRTTYGAHESRTGGTADIENTRDSEDTGDDAETTVEVLEFETSATPDQPTTGFSGSRGWLAAAVLLAVLAAGFWWSRSEQPSIDGSPGTIAATVATVDMVRGEVMERLESKAGSTKTERALEAGADLAEGAIVTVAQAATSEPSSGEPIASFVLASGHSLRLAAGSEVRLLGSVEPGDKTDQGASVVELNRGRLYIASPAAGDHSSPGVVVKTPLGEVRELGTQFEVALIDAADAPSGPALRTRVREGSVRLQAVGETVTARAGEQLLLAGDLAASETIEKTEKIVRSEIAIFGDEWSWVLAGAPAFQVGGHTIADLLNWLARETGREVTYQNDAVERAAETLVEGAEWEVRPAQALEVLRTAGLQASFAEGKIVVIDAAP